MASSKTVRKIVGSIHANGGFLLSSVIRLLRPKQWTKGFLVFAALLFTRSYTDEAQVVRALLAFVAMAVISSAVYVFNDLMDVRRDRAHPVKRNRPIASFQVSVSAAICLMVLCLALGLGLAWYLGRASLGVVLAYLLLQGAYNLGLKRQPVADVFALSFGFVLRAALGAAAIHVTLSGWLLFCTGALALLLGFGKRRHEFILQGDQRGESRESLTVYTRSALDAMLLVAASGAAMSYGIYSIESATARKYPGLVVTSVFVCYGICRYLFLLLAKDEGGEPESLVFRDPHMIVTILLFLASAVFALSGVHIPLIDPAG